METLVAEEVISAVAWLVCQDNTVGLPDRVPLTHLPFTLGRSDTTDLRINSNWVSREHAVIVKEGSEFRARDLGSTNGTFLNGEAIQDAVLQDGDVLRIGDTNLVFSSDQAVANRGIATQVMESPSAEARELPREEFVYRLRRTQELTLHQAFDTRVRSIVELKSGKVRALHLAMAIGQFEFARAGWHAIPYDSAGQPGWRARLLARLAAMEQFSRQSNTDRIFVRIEPTELDQWDATASQIAMAAAQHSGILVLELPANAHVEPALRKQIRNTANDWGAELAIGGFAGIPTQLREQKDLAPAFVTLRKGMLQAATDATENRLKSVLTACKEMGAEPIVDGTGNDEERTLWKSWGIPLMFGEGASA